jgi:hypothetical protein
MNTVLTTVYTTGRSRLTGAVEDSASKHRADCATRLEKRKTKTKKRYGYKA